MIYDPYYSMSHYDTLCLSMCYTFRWDRDPISYKIVRENKKDEAFWNHQPATIFSLILALRSIYSSSGRSAGISGGFNTLVWKMCWHLLQTQARPSRLGRCLATWSSNFWHRSAYISVYWCCLLQASKIIDNNSSRILENSVSQQVVFSAVFGPCLGKVPRSCSQSFSNFSGVNLLMMERHCVCEAFFFKRAAPLFGFATFASPFPLFAFSGSSRRRAFQGLQKAFSAAVSFETTSAWTTGASSTCFAFPLHHLGALYPAKSKPKTMSSIGIPYLKLRIATGERTTTVSKGRPTSWNDDIIPSVSRAQKNQTRTDLPMSMSRVLQHMTHGYIWWVTSFFPPNPSKTIRKTMKSHENTHTHTHIYIYIYMWHYMTSYV